MKPTRVSAYCEFRPDKCYPRLIHGSPGVRVFLLCLEPGQGLPPRADSEEMLCWIVDGSARVTIGEDAHRMEGGDFAAAGPGEVRGIEAEGRCVAVWAHVSGRGRSNA